MTITVKNKIIKDLTRYVPQVILPAILAFISVPIYTKLFDPSAYGNLYIAKAALNLLDRCSNWIGASLTRYYNEYVKSKSLNEMLTSIIKANVLIATFTTIPIFMLLKLLPIDSELKLLLQTGIVLFAFIPTGNVLRNTLRMERRINLHTIFIVFRNLFSFVVSLLLIYQLNMGIESIIIGELLVVVAIFPFLWKAALQNNFNMSTKLDLSIIRQFFNYGAPLTISIVGLWLLDFSDRYIIKYMLGSYAVGIYSACYNITWNSLFILVHLFYMMEEPLAMKIYVQEGADALKEFIRCELRLFLILIVPCVLFICVYSDTIFSFMVSKKYQSGTALVPYVSSSVLVAGIIYKYKLGIMAMEKTRSLMYIVIAAGIFNVLLNVALVPFYGIIGAAAGTLIAYTTYLSMIVVATKRIFPWRFPITSLLRITFCGMLPAGLSWITLNRSTALPLHILVALLYPLMYICLLVATNETSKSDIKSTLSVLTSSLRA
jgi:O-antigen/teichoic acid export membrane protein